jgi:hypothetical protein
MVQQALFLARRELRAELGLPDPRQHHDRKPRFSSTDAEKRRMRMESALLDAAVIAAYDQSAITKQAQRATADRDC